ncbi:MAG: hypothetical protein AAF499_14710 [Pseudomonadota bacterium]
MAVVIHVCGVLIGLSGVLLLTQPSVLMGFLQRHRTHPFLHAAAVVVRLILGTALVVLADVSRFPVAIAALGWLTLAAAVMLTLIGRDRFQRLMGWVLEQVGPYARAIGCVAVALGAFLVVAFR